MRTASTHLARRAQGTMGFYLSGIYRLASEKPIFLWGQAIAFKVLITIVPLLVLATGIVGRILQGDRAFDRISEIIRNFTPAYQGQALIDFLWKLSEASGTLTLIGIGGLIFSAMTLFTTLRIVISSVFQEKWHEDRSILGGYLFDIRMAAQVGLFFLLTIGVSIALQTLRQAGPGLMTDLGVSYDWLERGWGQLFTVVGLVFPILLNVVMFSQLYFFVPKPHPPKRSALLGAAVAAFLWELAKSAFAFYATYVGRWERYAEAGDGPLAALGSTFALVIVFVFWAYYSGMVLVVGAMVSLLSEKRRRQKLRAARLRRRKSEADLPPEALALEAVPAIDDPALPARQPSE